MFISYLYFLKKKYKKNQILSVFSKLTTIKTILIKPLIKKNN